MLLFKQCNTVWTRQSKHCGFSIYIFDNSKSKSMVRLVRAEKMVLSGLVFARKIARMILIQNIQGLMGPLMINMAFMPLYMWEMWDVTPVTDGHSDEQWKVVQYSVWAESAKRELVYKACIVQGSKCYFHIGERLWSSGRAENERGMNGYVKMLWKKNSYPRKLFSFFKHFVQSFWVKPDIWQIFVANILQIFVAGKMLRIPGKAATAGSGICCGCPDVQYLETHCWTMYNTWKHTVGNTFAGDAYYGICTHYTENMITNYLNWQHIYIYLAWMLLMPEDNQLQVLCKLPLPNNTSWKNSLQSVGNVSNLL